TSNQKYMPQRCDTCELVHTLGDFRRTDPNHPSPVGRPNSHRALGLAYLFETVTTGVTSMPHLGFVPIEGSEMPLPKVHPLALDVSRATGLLLVRAAVQRVNKLRF